MTPSIVRAAGALLLLSACNSSVSGSGNAAATTPMAADRSRISDPGDNAGDTTTAQNADAPSATNKTDRSFERQLTLSLVGRATFDGENVTGVRVIDKCHTVFTTAKGETTIEWAKAGNLAPSDVNGREINRLPSADEWHDVSVPQGELTEPVGDIANRTSGAFAQLALECDPTNR